MANAAWSMPAGMVNARPAATNANVARRTIPSECMTSSVKIAAAAPRIKSTTPIAMLRAKVTMCSS